MQFCKEFNARTSNPELEGLDRPGSDFSVYQDRSHDFVTKTPAGSGADQALARIWPRGLANPTATKVGSITLAQLEEIAKAEDARFELLHSMEQAMACVRGTANSMGVQVV